MPEKLPRLEGKVAIVTGAGSRAPGPGIGTGTAIAALCAREGAKVILMDQVESHANETLAVIRGEGGEASVFVGDITKAAGCEGAVQAAVDRYGGLHVLVNNVGVMRRTTAVEVSEEDWDFLLNVNLKGMMLMARAAIPRMIAGGGGSIINISSVGSIKGAGEAYAYHVSKGGVNAMTLDIAMNYGRQGVRCNAILPGNIVTPMTGLPRPGRPGMSPERREAQKNRNALGTEGTGWDIAWAAVFLASDEARWVTAVLMPVDAGFSVAPPSWLERYPDLSRQPRPAVT